MSPAARSLLEEFLPIALQALRDSPTAKPHFPSNRATYDAWRELETLGFARSMGTGDGGAYSLTDEGLAWNGD